MSDQIWVFGATGRSGRGIASRLIDNGHDVVLVSRDGDRLRSLASTLNEAATVSATFDVALAKMRAAAPKVVVNTVGPFAETTRRMLAACPPGTHAVDIANELPAVAYALDQHDAAIGDDSTIVTGAGFGVIATESIVVKMCSEWPRPSRVRVDAMASLAVEAGVIGEALAGSILGGLPDGGRAVDQGALVRARVADLRTHLTAPNGDSYTTATLPTGDLIAAWRASGATSVVCGSTMIPSGPAVRLLLPAASLLARATFIRRFAIGRLAKVKMRSEEMTHQYSWGHCAMEWADGTSRHGWLRLGDAQAFTIAAAAEIAHRLTETNVQPGAYTPASLFGSTLAEDLGAHYFI